MLVDMLEEVYKDIETEKAANNPLTDPAVDEMTKALAESNKKIEELKTKFDKLASAGSSIETTNNKEPEDGTETAKESEESNNENQNS